jgi:hypothetical protein
VREPSITLTCDCGNAALVGYGKRWTCESCGKTWDTSQIPREEYDALLASVKRYRLLTIGPPLALCAVLVPLAIFVDVRYAFLLFVLILAHGLLILPHLRRRASQHVLDSAPKWKLRPE